MRRHGLFLAAILTWLCSAGGAQAQHLYAGGLGGYGFGTEKHQPVNPYGVGLGLSAGIVLPVTPIYAGARIVGFFGAKGHVAEPTGTTTSSVELSRSYLTYGIDIGYEVGDKIVLRPMLGIGRAVLKAHATSTSTLSTSGTFHGSDGSLYLSPGVALLLKSGLLFMGIEGHYNFLTESRHVSGLSVLASLGLTL